MVVINCTGYKDSRSLSSITFPCVTSNSFIKDSLRHSELDILVCLWTEKSLPPSFSFIFNKPSHVSNGSLTILTPMSHKSVKTSDFPDAILPCSWKIVLLVFQLHDALSIVFFVLYLFSFTLPYCIVFDATFICCHVMLGGVPSVNK